MRPDRLARVFRYVADATGAAIRLGGVTRGEIIEWTLDIGHDAHVTKDEIEYVLRWRIEELATAGKGERV